jgi:hypothetical protein
MIRAAACPAATIPRLVCRRRGDGGPPASPRPRSPWRSWIFAGRTRGASAGHRSRGSRSRLEHLPSDPRVSQNAVSLVASEIGCPAQKRGPLARGPYERGRKMPELKSVRKIVGARGYPLSAIEKTEAFLGELRLESLVEARTKPDGGFFLTPASGMERSGDEGPRPSTPGRARSRLSWDRRRQVLVSLGNVSLLKSQSPAGS